jgi:hypothetical protein
MAKIVEEGDSQAPPWWAYASNRLSNQTDLSFTVVIVTVDRH